MSRSLPPPALVTAFGGRAAFTHLAGLGDGAWVVESEGEPTVVASLASAAATEAARVAGERGVGPRVVRAGEGWLATERLGAVHLTSLELRRPTTCRELAELLARWHRTPPSAFEAALPRADLATSLRMYASELEADPGPRVGLDGPLRDAVASTVRALEHLPPPSALVPCHLDVAANLVQTPVGLRLVDFDFAALAPAAQELGQIIWEAELDRRGAAELVGDYVSSTWVTTEVGVAEAATWCVAAGVTWTLWASGRPGQHMSRYARRCWERVSTHWAWADVAACG